MQICPHCHTEYNDTRKFCRHDGSSLEPHTANEETVNTADGLRTEENRPKRQGVQKKITKGVGLVLVATLLLISGVLGYRKAWHRLPTPSLQGGKLVAAIDNQSASLPPREQPSSPSAETVSNQPPGSNGEISNVKDFIPETTKGTHEDRQVSRPVPEKPKIKRTSGLYRVIASAPLQSEPRANASVVAELKAGIKVRVVGVAGDYLEVRSRQGRAPGYIHQKDVVLMRSE